MLSVHWSKDYLSGFAFLLLCVGVHGANKGADACVLSGIDQSGSSPAFLNSSIKTENPKLVAIQI